MQTSTTAFSERMKLVIFSTLSTSNMKRKVFGELHFREPSAWHAFSKYAYSGNLVRQPFVMTVGGWLFFPWISNIIYPLGNFHHIYHVISMSNIIQNCQSGFITEPCHKQKADSLYPIAIACSGVTALLEINMSNPGHYDSTLCNLP